MKKQVPLMTRFYEFNQNNSGGRFITNSRVAQFVIIEAESADDANTRAEDLGIYFDGCEDGFDCPCCGDRWYPAYDNGYNTPSIHSYPAKEYDPMFCNPGDVYAYVYYIDGRKEVLKK